jgi:hypothetical protein
VTLNTSRPPKPSDARGGLQGSVVQRSSVAPFAGAAAAASRSVGRDVAQDERDAYDWKPWVRVFQPVDVRPLSEKRSRIA